MIPALISSHFFSLSLSLFKPNRLTREERRNPKMATLNDIPEECIAQFISLTSPLDACRLSAVSSTFRSAADSDAVWLQFLPPDYPSLLSRALHPFPFSSKKELFFLLCDRHVLIDTGEMSFGLDRSSGAMCYMLSPRSLSIVWGDTPQFWRWISLPDSRFAEVAELINVYWLEIRAKLQLKLLTSKTTYAAYLVFKISGNGQSFSFQTQETAVITGSHISSRTVSVAPDPDATRRNSLMFRNFLRWRGVLTLPTFEQDDGDDYDEDYSDGDEKDEVGFANLRSDGWMEIELGEFYNEAPEENQEVEMSFMEVKGLHCKRGLIVQGIEIRPK